jgi:hypothetical protein
VKISTKKKKRLRKKHPNNELILSAQMTKNKKIKNK